MGKIEMTIVVFVMALMTGFIGGIVIEREYGLRSVTVQTVEAYHDVSKPLFLSGNGSISGIESGKYIITYSNPPATEEEKLIADLEYKIRLLEHDIAHYQKAIDSFQEKPSSEASFVPSDNFNVIQMAGYINTENITLWTWGEGE